MHNLLNWIKNNKLLTLVVVALAYYILIKPFFSFMGSTKSVYESDSFSSADSVGSLPFSAAPAVRMNKGITVNTVPQMEIEDRKVVRNSNLSLVVKDVRAALGKIEEETTLRKGYLVNSSINRPEEGASGLIEIRIPSDELKSMLNFLRGLSIKVVSENITGLDITDQYVDIQARLDILNRNKTTYMQIMEQATTVDEIMRVQEQIFNLQNQIDNYQGQLKYMEGVSSSSLITIHISTDELSLPYTPDQAWRPNVVFKQAVRSLILTLRTVADKAIWLAVFSVIWLPVVLIIILIRKRHLKPLQSKK